MGIDKNDRHDKRRATESVVNWRLVEWEREIETGKWTEREKDWETNRKRNKQKER